MSQSVGKSVGRGQSCNRSATHTACHRVGSVTLTLCIVCRFVTLHFWSLCESVAQTVCRPVDALTLIKSCRFVTHTAWRSVTHILSVGLSLIRYPLLCHSRAISRSVLSIALPRMLRVALPLKHTARPQAFKSRATPFQLLTQCYVYAVLSSLMLLPHTVSPSHSTFTRSVCPDRLSHSVALSHTHTRFTCHTLSLASVKDPLRLRNSASRIGTEESNLEACHAQARSAHKSLAPPHLDSTLLPTLLSSS